MAEARRSVVEVPDRDEPTALGTVVDTAGLVLTTACGVPAGARCRLPYGQVRPSSRIPSKPRRAERPPVPIRLLEAMPRHPLQDSWPPWKSGVTPLRSLKRDSGDILSYVTKSG